MFRRSSLIKVSHPSDAKAIPILYEGAIAVSDQNEGAIIPLVIIDTALRPDIDELIRLHKFADHGHAKFTWGKQGRLGNHVSLFIEFDRPKETTIVLNFDIKKFGVTVEQILNTRGLYLAPGVVGERTYDVVDRPKVLLEIPDTGFAPYWGKLYRKFLLKEFKKHGHSRSEAKEVVEQYLSEVKKFGFVRIG